MTSGCVLQLALCKFYQHLELKREWNELARKSAIPTSRSAIERIYPPLEPGEVSVEWSA